MRGHCLCLYGKDIGIHCTKISFTEEMFNEKLQFFVQCID